MSTKKQNAVFLWNCILHSAMHVLIMGKKCRFSPEVAKGCTVAAFTLYDLDLSFAQ